MARRMKDPAFRQQQRESRMDPHIAPINQLVADLQDPEAGLWLPEVAPMHAGIDALVVSVLRDPGPKTQEDTGSGFLCIENDDPTAERQLELFEQHSISVRQVLPWNAYPWYINRAPNAAELKAGAEVLYRLLNLAPDCRVILLQGTHAVDAWRRLLKQHPTFAQQRGIEAVESIHPGRQALWTADPAERQARLDKQQAAYQRVATIINAS
ncbi:uracil-DNA glycosylase [Mycobacteroides abscessus]|uniref:uracil-DNA glycosylase n=1 Tax=Mycobacteroides abscessus TaxID=36809 RepID=UPI001C2B8B05|nr:uracil-DNA glycosylase [Mycobacteroides abscessus]